MLCYVMLCYVMLCYVMWCCIMLCYVMLRYVILCYDMLCYVMLWYVMLCYVMLWYVMLCYVMLCYVMICCDDIMFFVLIIVVIFTFSIKTVWSLLHCWKLKKIFSISKLKLKLKSIKYFLFDIKCNSYLLMCVWHNNLLIIFKAWTPSRISIDCDEEYLLFSLLIGLE